MREYRKNDTEINYIIFIYTNVKWLYCPFNIENLR